MEKSKGRILLVDDDYSVRQVVTFSLEASGWHVTPAMDGREGLSIYRIALDVCVEPFDCVITDYQMPFMNGVELCERIKELNPSQRIILMSGGDPKVPEGVIFKSKGSFRLSELDEILSQ